LTSSAVKIASIIKSVNKHASRNTLSVHIDLDSFTFQIFNKKDEIVCSFNTSGLALDILSNFTDIYLLDMDTRGTGKSVACLASQIMFNTALNTECIDDVKRARYIVARSTYGELESTTIKTYREWFDREELNFRIKYKPFPESHLNFFASVKKNGETKSYQFEIEVLFFSFDSAESAKKLKSAEATGIYFNELSEIPCDALDLVSGCLGRFPSASQRKENGVYYHRVLADSNAFDDSHYLYNRFVKQVHPSHKFYKGLGGLNVVDDVNIINNVIIKISQENTALVEIDSVKYLKQDKLVFCERKDADNVKNLPKDFYIKMALGKSDKWILTQICNKFGTTDEGSRVHPEFDINKHSIATIAINKAFPISIYFDYGGFNAAIITQYYNRTLYVIKEFLDSEIGLSRFASDIVKKWVIENAGDCRLDKVVGDKANNFNTNDATYSHDTVKNATGWNVRGCITNDLDKRKNVVAKILLSQVASGEYCVKVSKDGCGLLTEGLNDKYRLKQVKSIVGNEIIVSDKPDKNSVYSHVADTFQYACLDVDFIESQNVALINNEAKFKAYSAIQVERVIL